MKKNKCIKYFYFIIPLFLISITCIVKIRNNYISTDLKFNSIMEQIDYLDFTENKAVGTMHPIYEPKSNKKYVKKFFKSLPRNFKTFFIMTANATSRYEIYDYNKWSDYEIIDKNGRLLTDLNNEIEYSYRPYQYSIGNRILSELEKVIPLYILYEKFVSMFIGGFLDSGAIYELHHFLQESLICDNKLKCIINSLEKRSDREIASFWFFIYDGPHPENYKDYYDIVYPKIPIRIAKLMKEAYTDVLSQEHCCGH